MAEASRHDAWQAGDRYEAYMGRWSRQIAPRFLDWLGTGDGLDWLDIGCGTGALSAAILAQCNPKIDPALPAVRISMEDCVQRGPPDTLRRAIVSVAAGEAVVAVFAEQNVVVLAPVDTVVAATAECNVVAA